MLLIFLNIVEYIFIKSEAIFWRHILACNDNIDLLVIF